MRGPGLRLIAALALIAVVALVGAPAVPAQDEPPDPNAGLDPASYPWKERVEEARLFARGRRGSVSFAVVDESGLTRAYRGRRRYRTASVIKVMLLVGYLRSADVRDRRLTSSEKRILDPMIRVSDNGAATAIRDRIGNAGLSRLARAAGMTHFSTHRHWGLSKITASDQARFMFRLDELLPRRHRHYAKRLLRSVVPSQSNWGVARARLPEEWRIHLKVGLLPRLGRWYVHEVSLLTRGERRLSLAILTRGPGKEYGKRTMRGIARRLLLDYPA